MNQDYIDTVRLLLDVAPAVFQSPRFAMKGGTALNLFVQDMPRLSVDIDVVFTDHTLDREAALQAIGADLNAVRGGSRTGRAMGRRRPASRAAARGHLSGVHGRPSLNVRVCFAPLFVALAGNR
jgi:hypothetical protein